MKVRVIRQGLLPPASAAAVRQRNTDFREEAILREGLAQGAVAMGFGSAYTPGAPISEIERMFRVAAAGGVSAHIHMRGGLAGLQETIAAAKSAGVPLHIVHVNSSADTELEDFSLHQSARTGADVTTEAYPTARHDRHPVLALATVSPADAASDRPSVSPANG